ncbi:MAG: cobalt ECF transporter T component CbiQ [Syntrophus sp. SKADARSKE-3]|nr:cobalt ECF transporter T component CbiQ [Syntrophus sp. SKADARSKE-3]
MENRIPAFLLQTPYTTEHDRRGDHVSQWIIDKGIRTFSSLILSLSREEDIKSRRGLFQSLDARVKIVFLVLFVAIVSLKQTMAHEAAISFIVFSLAVLSRILLGRFYLRITGLTFFFGFLVAFPAAMNIITPGELLWPLMSLDRSYTFWIYHIPRDIGFTVQGLESLAMLCLRVFNSLSISFLMLFTTPLSEMIKGLQIFRIPGTFLLIITLSMKYIVVFSRNVEDMYLARKSRSLTTERGQAARMWVAGRIAYIFRRSERRYEEIYRAMTARGYAQDYRQPHLKDLAMMDRFAFGIMLLTGMFFLIW